MSCVPLCNSESQIFITFIPTLQTRKQSSGKPHHLLRMHRRRADPGQEHSRQTPTLSHGAALPPSANQPDPSLLSVDNSCLFGQKINLQVT